jgi:hypothetical protein
MMKIEDVILKQEFIKRLQNDNEIIDFLADMRDREPLYQLQRFINYSNHEANAIVHKSTDGIYTLILYKAPLGIRDENNTLTLFVHNNMGQMCAHFKKWLDMTNSFNKELYQALDEITRILYYNWAQEQDDNTQLNHQG